MMHTVVDMNTEEAEEKIPTFAEVNEEAALRKMPTFSEEPCRKISKFSDLQSPNDGHFSETLKSEDSQAKSAAVNLNSLSVNGRLFANRILATATVNNSNQSGKNTRTNTGSMKHPTAHSSKLQSKICSVSFILCFFYCKKVTKY